MPHISIVAQWQHDSKGYKVGSKSQKMSLRLSSARWKFKATDLAKRFETISFATLDISEGIVLHVYLYFLSCTWSLPISWIGLPGQETVWPELDGFFCLTVLYEERKNYNINPKAICNLADKRVQCSRTKICIRKFELDQKNKGLSRTCQFWAHLPTVDLFRKGIILPCKDVKGNREVL